jgi:uncharacterized membrane protein required for colicin V production
MDYQAIIETATNLHWIDNVGAGVAALFLLLGLCRGLWWQVVRLLGLAAAVVVARWAGPILGEDMASWAGLNGNVASGLGWISAFLLTLIGACLLGMVGNKTIEAMKLSLINRFLGGLAGLATGLLLYSALTMVGSSFASDTWRQTTFPPTYSGQLVVSLTERWPVLRTVPDDVLNGLSPPQEK